MAFQYKVLLVGLSLCTRIFTKVVVAALSPLREVGIHVVNYLDDWLICCVNTGTWYSGTSAIWCFGSTGRGASSPLCRASFFSVWSWTVMVKYTNNQGGVGSCRMSQLVRHLLLWSQQRLRLLRAIHIPGELNCGNDAPSRQLMLLGEWRLYPHVIYLIWSQIREVQVDLFASKESSHYPLFYSLMVSL